ncbi:hypothetical protein QEN19_000639 [Hanseniaspora menglaensis]
MSTEKDFLVNEIESKILNFDSKKLIKKCQDSLNHLQQELSGTKSTSVIKPLPSSNMSSVINNPNVTRFEELGLKALLNNEVAIILMAGGQGTRLGSKDPKGCYDIHLSRFKSLFEIQLKSVVNLQNKIFKLYKKNIDIPFYIMVSPATFEKTNDFLITNKWFGLKESQFKLFNQGTLPALDKEGKNLLISQDKSNFIYSPDGNGGLYKALRDNGILKDMISKNVKHIHMYCVDNVLVKIADPVFIGYAIDGNFKLCTKVVRKEDPEEKVGLIVLKDNKPAVIEYSEINASMTEELDETDSRLLKYRCANIVNHYYNISLFEKDINYWIENLPYHIASKKIPCFDFKSNKPITPSEPNGIKLEQFIFDVFPFVDMKDFGCLEVDRTEEFSPLKNGLDASSANPVTCKDDFIQRSKNWKLKYKLSTDVEEICAYEF